MIQTKNVKVYFLKEPRGIRFPGQKLGLGSWFFFWWVLHSDSPGPHPGCVCQPCEADSTFYRSFRAKRTVQCVQCMAVNWVLISPLPLLLVAGKLVIKSNNKPWIIVLSFEWSRPRAVWALCWEKSHLKNLPGTKMNWILSHEWPAFTRLFTYLLVAHFLCWLVLVPWLLAETGQQKLVGNRLLN